MEEAGSYVPLRKNDSDEQEEPAAQAEDGDLEQSALVCTPPLTPSMERASSSASTGRRKSSHVMIADDDKLLCWQIHVDELETAGKTDIFSQNESLLAEDSGLADVDKILYSLKYLTAVVVVLSLVANVYTIVAEDTPLLTAKEGDSANQFLITRHLGKSIFGNSIPYLDHVVPIFELLCLGTLVLRMTRYAFMAYLENALCSTDESFASLVRWSYASSLFWTYIPYLGTFSALKCLYYVTPSVLGTEIYNVFVKAKFKHERGDQHDAAHAFLMMAWYLLSRLGCLIVGLDAFLVKFRIAEKYANSTHVSFHALLYCLVFLFQVLSIVNVNTFVRERLFIFMFAGEDGTLDLTEENRKDVWCALVSREIFTKLGTFKGLIAMLSFDDYDFQLLVMDPSKKNW